MTFSPPSPKSVVRNPERCRDNYDVRATLEMLGESLGFHPCEAEIKGKFNTGEGVIGVAELVGEVRRGIGDAFLEKRCDLGRITPDPRVAESLAPVYRWGGKALFVNYSCHFSISDRLSRIFLATSGLFIE